tara:strand:- start:44523 stop:45407 length:885 start_codon:yes stop_codon:yes gene_type:complete
MENWRRFVSEQMAAGQENVYPDMLKNLQELPDKVPPLTSTDIRHLIGLVDPTQMTAYPDIPPAIKEWENNPSWSNSALLVLALLAVIPLVGKGAKVVSRFSKSLKSVKGGEKMANKISSAAGNLSKGGRALSPKEMTDKMHEMWLVNYRKTNGNTPRLKPIPNADPGDIKKYSGVREVDGQLVQDINQSADKIHPNLAHKLNGAPATDYAKSINTKSLNTPADVDTLADDFHNVWMKHNGWQRESAPQLFKPYAQLTPDEKIKDLQQVLVAVTLKYGPNSPQVKMVNSSISKLQ